MISPIPNSVQLFSKHSFCGIKYSIIISVSIAQFGTDCKLQLDYWWEKEQDSRNSDVICLSTGMASERAEKSKLSESLNKLISIAKLYLNKEKVCNGFSEELMQSLFSNAYFDIQMFL